MHRKRFLSKNDLPFYILYLVITISGAYVLSGTWLITNIDSLSYLSIAKLYANGEVWKGINSFWSPMLSWLVVPFHWIKLDPLYFGKMLSVISIVVTLMIVRRINTKLNVNPIFSFFSLATIAAIVFVPATYNFTPDVLSLVALLYLMLFCIDQKNILSRREAILLGIVCALGFLTKHYVFAYSLTFLTTWCIVRFAYEKESHLLKRIVKNYFIAVSVFLLIALPWIVLISIKEKKLTLSEAYAYNVSYVANPEEVATPFTTKGLLPLPYPEAYTYFDEPEKLPLMPFTWADAFSTSTLSSFQWERITDNYENFFGILDYMLGGYFLPIILTIVLISIYELATKRFTSYSTLLFAVIVYALPYIFLLVDYRYTTFGLLLFVILAYKVMNDVVTRFTNSNWILVLVGVQLFYLFGKKAVDKTIEFYEEGKSKRVVFEKIAPQIEAHQNCCSLYVPEIFRELIYLRDLKYYGRLKENDLVAMQSELDDYKIRYIFSQSEIPDSLQQLMHPIVENINGVWVYEINKH